MMIQLDGTHNKGKLGANAILGVSIAVARAAADLLGQPLYKYLGGFNGKQLPVPMMNIVNGGSHSDAPIAFQEFMILPVGAESFKESLRWGAEIFHNLKSILSERGLETAVGDEGGFAPRFEGTEDAVETIIKAIEKAGYKPGEDVFLGFDCASSEFYENGVYDYTKFEGEHGAKRSAAEQVDYLEELIGKYPIITIEDGMDENDWEGWKQLTDRIGDKVQLVGDDLFVTNTEILSKGIEQGIGNSILIKVNQIGTLTETFDAIEMAQKLDILRLYLTVLVKLKILQLLISQLLQMQVKLKQVHYLELTVLLNTINYYVLKMNYTKQLNLKELNLSTI